jgi:ketosteroid isomerase-like protein
MGGYTLALILLILSGLFACPLATSGQENPDWTSLVEAERAFAATSLAKGTRAAFLEFLAEDSILFRPGPVPGKKWIEEHPAPPTLLTWEPAFADVAQSGDFGYTTGPWEIRPSSPQDKPTAYGHFVSVWKRQPDGAWKVVLDLGISHAAPARNSKTLQPSNFKGGSEKARRNLRIDEERSELLSFDRELANSVSEKGSAQAYLRYLADDARLYRAKTFPVVGKREIFAILSQSGGKPALQPDKAGISNAADLGYTYGTSRSMAPGSADAAGAASNYVHIWKRRGNHWTLVLDVESPIPQRTAAQ